MDQHFYNGFIKRAQDYGLSVVEAERLIKAADDVDSGLNDHLGTGTAQIPFSAPQGSPKIDMTRPPLFIPGTTEQPYIPGGYNPKEYHHHPIPTTHVLLPNPGTNGRPLTYSYPDRSDPRARSPKRRISSTDPRSVNPNLALPDKHFYQMHPTNPNVLIPTPEGVKRGVRPTTYNPRKLLGLNPGEWQIGEREERRRLGVDQPPMGIAHRVQRSLQMEQELNNRMKLNPDSEFYKLNQDALRNNVRNNK